MKYADFSRWLRRRASVQCVEGYLWLQPTATWTPPPYATMRNLQTGLRRLELEGYTIENAYRGWPVTYTLHELRTQYLRYQKEMKWSTRRSPQI